jgi:hypothetical protein
MASKQAQEIAKQANSADTKQGGCPATGGGHTASITTVNGKVTEAFCVKCGKSCRCR